MAKKGTPLSPVSTNGRTIASTFWGKAWCDNLERYSDLANRLPRGRTYVRNGSVIDLQVDGGQVKALVSGSELYRVSVEVTPVTARRWRTLCDECAEGIDSLVELLQGRFAKGVMERLCAPTKGLFPAPDELSFSCSCPDAALMCKHVAATLYGVGARLDEKPELLFVLRKADHLELVSRAGTRATVAAPKPAAGKVLADADLSDVFGLDLAASEPKAEAGGDAPAAEEKERRRPKRRVGGKTASNRRPRRSRPASIRQPKKGRR
jgi:uncharacterized Zn finger protein